MGTLSFVKKDSLGWGTLLGLLAPILSLGLYYAFNIYPNSFVDFLSFILKERRLFSSLVVICLVLNIALFTAYVNTRRDQTAKGIFVVTLLYAIAGLLVKVL